MLLHPAIVALLASSALVCAMTAVAAVAGIGVVAGFDPSDGGARQLARERRALLVEAALKLVLGFELLSLVLFAWTLESLHPLFTGAMCAAGTLAASPLGYPTLAVKVFAFLVCGVWLVTSRAAAATSSRRVVFVRHLSVVAILLVLGAENVLQWSYFQDLDPAIVTSCCATVFNERATGLGGGLAAVPAGVSRVAFFGLLVLVLATGVRRSAGWLFPFLTTLTGAAAAVAVVAWVAPSYYELPTHHCPFCLLAAEQGWVGYPLYAALMTAVVTGIGSGLVDKLRIGEARRLRVASMVGFALFALIAAWPDA